MNIKTTKPTRLWFCRNYKYYEIVNNQECYFLVGLFLLNPIQNYISYSLVYHEKSLNITIQDNGTGQETLSSVCRSLRDYVKSVATITVSWIWNLSVSHNHITRDIFTGIDNNRDDVGHVYASIPGWNTSGWTWWYLNIQVLFYLKNNRCIIVDVTTFDLFNNAAICCCHAQLLVFLVS